MFVLLINISSLNCEIMSVLAVEVSLSTVTQGKALYMGFLSRLMAGGMRIYIFASLSIAFCRAFSCSNHFSRIKFLVAKNLDLSSKLFHYDAIAELISVTTLHCDACAKALSLLRTAGMVISNRLKAKGLPICW